MKSKTPSVLTDPENLSTKKLVVPKGESREYDGIAGAPK